MNRSKIEWTDFTWNPITGCSHASEGCRNCYAERMAHRLVGMGIEGYVGVTAGGRWTGKVRCHEDVLLEPLRRKKPARIFVCSMADLYHPGVPDEFRDKVKAVEALCPQHTFIEVTKRPKLAAEYSTNGLHSFDVALAVQQIDPTIIPDGPHVSVTLADLGISEPLPNVHLLTSIENQVTADERIPDLLKCPAAVRGVSVEPMLGPVDIGLDVATCKCCSRWASRWIQLTRPVGPDLPHLLSHGERNMVADVGIYRAESNKHGALSVRTPSGLLGIKPGEFNVLPAPDWVICGPETGPGKRPMDPAWAIDLYRQCKAASVPFFWKGGDSVPELAGIQQMPGGRRPT